MPLYEYRCQKCQHHLEIIQRINDRPLLTCPDCGGPLVRLISSPAIQFKGSGWYITDYAHNKNSSAGGNGQNGSNGRQKSSGHKTLTEETKDLTQNSK